MGIVRRYLDTLIVYKGYAPPAKWAGYNKMNDLDSINNKRIYFRKDPEEMYLISFNGMLILNDVFNPAIKEMDWVAEDKLMTEKEESRVKNRFQKEILDSIVAMAKRDGLSDSVIYKY